MSSKLKHAIMMTTAIVFLLAALLTGLLPGGAGPAQASALFQSPLPTLPNDQFGRAQTISALPSVVYSDITNATKQAGEPSPSCAGSTFGQSIWYAYTSTANGSLTAYLEGWNQQTLAVYTGSSLRELTQVACTGIWSSSSFAVQAGQTYYVQLGDSSGYGGNVTFRLEMAPTPQAAFYYYPEPPSTLEAVSFSSNAYDPAGVGITKTQWDFGDGAKATGSAVSHQYAAEGQYRVKHTVKTSDGRVGSTTQTVVVKTNDVYITRMVRPRTAVVGQTKRIIVSVGNQRYPQQVRVELYRSVPGGYAYVGSLEQWVDVNRTTDFYLGYTFTAADARIGKVTFKAVAMITDGRDALPADNEFITLPVIVTLPTGRSAEETLAVDDLSQHEEDLESNKAADGPLVAETVEAVTEEQSAEGVKYYLYMPLIEQ